MVFRSDIEEYKLEAEFISSVMGWYSTCQSICDKRHISDNVTSDLLIINGFFSLHIDQMTTC